MTYLTALQQILSAIPPETRVSGILLIGAGLVTWMAWKSHRHHSARMQP